MVVTAVFVVILLSSGCARESSDEAVSLNQLTAQLAGHQYTVTDKRQAGAESTGGGYEVKTETVPCHPAFPEGPITAPCRYPQTRTVEHREYVSPTTTYTFIVEYEDIEGRRFEWTGRSEHAAGSDLRCYRRAEVDKPLPDICR